jgi:glycerol dehydrogenase
LTAAPGTHSFFHGEKVAFGVLVQLVLEGKPRAVFNEVLAFATEVGLPLTAAEIGLGELSPELLQCVAARATAKGETIHNEPFEVTSELAADAIRAADSTGRAWKERMQAR